MQVLTVFEIVFYLICAVAIWVHLNPRANRHTPPFKRRATIRCAGATAIAPKNQRKPEWVRAELIRLAALCGGSRRNVARLFNQLHGTRHGVTVGHSFTCELLKAHAVQVLRLRRELKSKTPAVVPICHTWAMDMTFYTDDANMTHASLGIIDHGSRALLCLQRLTCAIHGHCWVICAWPLAAMASRAACAPIMKRCSTLLCLRPFSNLQGFKSKPPMCIRPGKTAEWSGCLVR